MTTAEAGQETGTTAPGAEIRALLSSLEGQRRHVLGILEGLDAEALRRPVLPSGWTCLGLVQHLALDVERFWFRAVFTGDSAVIAALDEIDDAWQVAPGATGAEVLDRYRAETGLADAVITAAVADAPWPGGPTRSSANRTCTPCGTSCCTSSPRPRATPVISTRHANSSTAGGGWS